MRTASRILCISAVALAAAVALALFVRWRRLPVDPSSSRDRPTSASLENDARWVLEKHCGLCHREDSPQAKSGALAVFDLNRPDWSASMTKERFASARKRLVEAPTGGDPAPQEDVEIFDAFVAAGSRQN